jgi:hypothetical protein
MRSSIVCDLQQILIGKALNIDIWRASSAEGDKGKAYKFRFESLNDRDHSEGLDINKRIVLKLILGKHCDGINWNYMSQVEAAVGLL